MPDKVNITCEDIKKNLKAFLDDLLVEGEYKAFCDHINGCSKCGEYVRSIGSLTNQLWKLGKVRVPEDLGSAILYKFTHSEQKIQSSKFVISKKHIIIGSILILLAVMAASGINYLRGRGVSPTPHPERTLSDSEEGVEGSFVLVRPSRNKEDVPIVRTEIVRTLKPPSDDEARILLKQLEVIATGLGVFEKDRTAEDASKKEDIIGEETSIVKGSPAQESKIIDSKVIPLHWHFQYSEKINEAGLEAERQRIKQKKELVKEKLDGIERGIRLLEEEKEKNRIKLGQRYSQELKATELAKERQRKLKLQQRVEEKKQQEAIIKHLEEEKHRLEFNRQQRLKDGRRKQAVHKTKILNILNILGIMPDYKNDHLFVFSVSGEKLEDVREQILFASQGTSSFRDFTNGTAILPHKEYHVSMYFHKKGIPALHWHINPVVPGRKSDLFSIIEKKSASIDYKSDELLIFSIPDTELKNLLIQIQATGVNISKYGSGETKKDILHSGLITISIYFTK